MIVSSYVFEKVKIALKYETFLQLMPGVASDLDQSFHLPK